MDMPLSDGVKTLMTILAARNTDGFTIDKLHRYMGFAKDGTLQPSTYTGRRRFMRGQAIYDAAGELITIHRQVMHGSAYDDRRRPSGRTTERDYMVHIGHAPSTIRRWFSKLYYGLDTDNIAEAKAYAHAWVEHLEPRRENHQDAINEYNNVILNEACFRIEDGTASYQEHLFVQHAIGEGSDAGYPTDLGSTSDDEFDFGSDFGYSPDPDYQSKNTGAMHNGAMTISAAAAEERAAQRIRDRERERTVNHDSMIDGMWRASLKFIMATIRQISCAGQSIRSKALRTVYFNRLEAELMEALTYIQKKFGLVNAEDTGAPTPTTRRTPPFGIFTKDEDTQQAEIKGMWKGGVKTLNAQLKHLSVTGQQFRTKV
jgi:hypothetical protein